MNNKYQAKDFIGYDNAAPTAWATLSIIIGAVVLFLDFFVVTPMYAQFVVESKAFDAEITEMQKNHYEAIQKIR